MGNVLVQAMTAEHAGPVLSIYQSGIDEGDATFETQAPAWAEFNDSRLPEHRFVAVDVAGTAGSAGIAGAGFAGAGFGGAGGVIGRVVGWVAASPVSSRCVYAGVVEHSVYVDRLSRGRGVGRLLLGALIESTEAAGIWTIQSGIFPENAASVALHRAAGFRVVGRRERIGQQHGRWRDILLIERRSPAI
jgi:L-amino acid N-acyltransferase YncA